MKHHTYFEAENIVIVIRSVDYALCIKHFTQKNLPIPGSLHAFVTNVLPTQPEHNGCLNLSN